LAEALAREIMKVISGDNTAAQRPTCAQGEDDEEEEEDDDDDEPVASSHTVKRSREADEEDQEGSPAKRPRVL